MGKYIEEILAGQYHPKEPIDVVKENMGELVGMTDAEHLRDLADVVFDNVLLRIQLCQELIRIGAELDRSSVGVAVERYAERCREYLKRHTA